MRFVALLALSALAAGSRAWADTGVQIRPASPVVVCSGPPTPAAFMVHVPAPAHGRRLPVTVIAAPGAVVESPSELRLTGADWGPLVVRVALPPDRDDCELTVRVGGADGRVQVVRGMDLTVRPWRQTFTPRTEALPIALAAVEADDSTWPELRVPALWNDNRYAWCRVHTVIPGSWRGKGVRLLIGAVDDNDVTYVNGREVGRTNGWDRRRLYTVPEDAIRWDADNVITVMVDNPTYGGGLYKAPIMLLAGRVASTTQAQAGPSASARGAARPAPGLIGPPRPLRRMVVRDGVLRYADGREVALWGVNCYPQSWYQFDNMKRLKIDMKATIRTDLDHLQQMGVEVIRIHVFDREISDAAGNLVRNEHLDLLDYLVAECSRRGIYMVFTPIAWWGGPNQRNDSFSAQTSKPGMMFVPSAVSAAARYLGRFLTHVNPYSHRAIRDEPCLCVLEVMNEPTYYLYGDLAGSAYPPQGETADVLARDHAELRRQWKEWLAALGLDDSPIYFPLFRYDQMRRYVRRMIAAIRATGAAQPVAISSFGVNGDDIADAIADSECDAITVSNYPGGWEKVNDGTNLIAAAGPLAIDRRYRRKARLAYEFDTPATNPSCYLYPVLAAHFRSGEVQIACQFQYDSIATARWNTDWNAHWLNWHYTPTKAVSYMVGGQAFRTLPRGKQFDAGTWQTPATSVVSGGMAASFAHNQSLFASDSLFMNARSVDDWRPLPIPASPSRIVGTGSSPFVEYPGSGAYVLQRVDARTWKLHVNPDAALVGNSLRSDPNSPVAELSDTPHAFRLKLPGWSTARCLDARGRPTPVAHGGWLVRAGEYTITGR